MSNAERVLYYAAAIFVPLSCLVGGLIVRPPIATYFGFALIGAAFALFPAGVAAVLETRKHYDYRDRSDRLDGEGQ